MNIKMHIMRTMMIAGACLATTVMANDQGELTPVEDQALIMQEFDRLHIEVPAAADLAVMNVRVFGPDNELLLSKRTMGESVDFMVDSGLPDGNYRY